MVAFQLQMLRTLPPVEEMRDVVSTVAISEDGGRYLWSEGSLGNDVAVIVREVAGGATLFELRGQHQKGVLKARFLRDGSIVSFGFDWRICKWDGDGRLLSSNDETRDYRADGFELSQDGKLALVGGYRGTIYGYSLDGGARLFEFEATRHPLWALALDPSGQQLLSGGAAGRLQLWRVGDLSLAHEIDLGWGHHVQGLAWDPRADRAAFVAAISPDGAAAKGSRNRLVLFDATNYQQIRTYDAGALQPFCCTFSPSGRLVAAAGGAERRRRVPILVWDVDSGRVVARLSGHTEDGVRDIAFSPDGRWLLSGAWDSTVRVWSIEA